MVQRREASTFGLITFYKKINARLHNKIAVPLILRLIHENETRRIALFIGAVLFTLGFLLQLGVVLLTLELPVR